MDIRQHYFNIVISVEIKKQKKVLKYYLKYGILVKVKKKGVGQMTMFMYRKKSKSKNIIIEKATFVSFIFKITNLLIVNLFDLTICKLVIFFGFDLFNLIEDKYLILER